MVQSVVGEAILSKLHDPRISPFASVTRVEVAADLQIADVHVSVLGDPGEGRRTLAGLTSAAGRIQSMLARTLQTRQCPRLRFHLDDSLKKGMETMRLIDESMAEIRARQESAETSVDPAENAPPHGSPNEPFSDPPSAGGAL
jgi:ribosome-binding factor A